MEVKAVKKSLGRIVLHRPSGIRYRFTAYIFRRHKAGFQTVGQCEWADYPTKILEKHWPSVPRWRDIRTLTKESLRWATPSDRTTMEAATAETAGATAAGEVSAAATALRAR